MSERAERLAFSLFDFAHSILFFTITPGIVGVLHLLLPFREHTGYLFPLFMFRESTGWIVAHFFFVHIEAGKDFVLCGGGGFEIKRRRIACPSDASIRCELNQNDYC